MKSLNRLLLLAALAVNRGYEIISDSELVALLKDRPVLYIPGKPAGQRVVLLEP